MKYTLDTNIFIDDFRSEEAQAEIQLIDVFVPAGSGGLNGPVGFVFGPDGNLYLTSAFTDQVLRYNGTTGAFIDVFASGGGIDNPSSVRFGPDGNLYVSGFFSHNVARYNGTTGAFIDTFIPAGSGGLNGADDIRFVTPVPEPSTIALFTLGALAMLIRLRSGTTAGPRRLAPARERKTFLSLW